MVCQHFPCWNGNLGVYTIFRLTHINNRQIDYHGFSDIVRTCWVVNPSIWITIKQVSVLSVQICHETKIWLMIAFKLPLTRNYWLVVYLPLWKIWVRQLGWWHSQYMEKNMFETTNQDRYHTFRWNHQWHSLVTSWHLWFILFAKKEQFPALKTGGVIGNDHWLMI